MLHVDDARGLTHLKSSLAMVKMRNFIFHLLEPCLKLLLGHLQVLDVGSGMVQERNLAWLLVGNRKGILELTVDPQYELCVGVYTFAQKYVGEDLKEDGIKLVNTDWYEQGMSVTWTQVDSDSKSNVSMSCPLQFTPKCHKSVDCTRIVLYIQSLQFPQIQLWSHEYSCTQSWFNIWRYWRGICVL